MCSLTVSSDCLIDSTSTCDFSTELIMDYSQPFSALNEQLRPRFTTSEQLYSSLNRVEDRQMGSLRSRSPFYRPTVLQMEPEPKVGLTVTEPEDPEEPEDDAEQEDSVSDGFDEGNSADLLHIDNSCLISELNLKDVDEEELVDGDNSSCQSEEKDSSGELTSEGTAGSSESAALAGEGGSCFQRSYIDRTLPDLIKSGRPLSRRRTVGHVSDTLKEVRREVELSRRRSIKLKAQVDKLQESRDGPGWSQHRERVTEEVLSVLRLLQPLTEPESSQPETSCGQNQLDAALAQLQNVARKLAISHTRQEIKSGKGTGAEDGAILQQALRDRDEAIEKKKAMEAELLRSKTEMMTLNNQLLEAAQKRLELSLELEAWKEDIQLIIQQQLWTQQQAEQQAQKKPSRLGILRRNNKPPIQRPANFPLSTPVPPTTNSNQIFVTKSAGSTTPAPSTPPTGSQRTWKDKLRRGVTGRQGDQDATRRGTIGRQGGQDAAGQLAERGRENDGFHVVSLD
ncbi:bicaudal-D-related protein 2-like [Thunnus thynnus]|uniref:bicaudal-D-related protein 2-like n=1 Tax=Thunnus thynnus TaxID=8237 RepID=UPI00352970A8